MPVRFIPTTNGRTEVVLGSQLVGVIERWHFEKSGDHGAYYWITLPVDGGRDSCHPAARHHEARTLILKRLADWFQEAGLSDIADEIQNQTVEETGRMAA